MRPLDILLLILVQIIWGANYAVQKDAIAAFPPLLLVGVGYLIIAATLTPFTRRTHSPQGKLALLANGEMLEAEVPHGSPAGELIAPDKLVTLTMTKIRAFPDAVAA